ncbi:Selenocysteine lyase/Cysteine desulfurase [Microbulbifer donghaiensis]|uniref:Selenocysteine lyase/Cysteine desulfurase n=1 Tax=Microbulbifer donghaiensis TaxID=494016 RepID=A0A1M5CSJ3_9GAMM|nr:aminotransferase class V-fold PLP-dependent enzyme [Microbulbifer donghaiensis]SHF57646.1 Selenocysteine lyase/Cysteine desulfurase [Microbulbifer donghaiensis]
MNALINTIRASVIGDLQPVETPFGRKPLVYADYTASGRALGFIEDHIRTQVLPYYANTHTETSYTGAQTTALREQARDEIRRAVNAGADDKVIFCGAGATAAVHKLIDILNLRLPADLDRRYRLQEKIPPQERPVVFIGPYEHHSNELPWRESIAELVCIPLDKNGMLDTEVLETQLRAYADRPLKIGSFSAASNVTGIKTDVDAVARLLHQYGALSFWDYAAAAPYVAIDMTGTKTAEGDSSKDAVFISPHKFIGGPGTPGILVVKQQVLNNSVPAVPGGGTVLYVTPEDHRYLTNAERSEEGGTPAIVESIRAGLVFKLQQAVGTDEIEKREADFVRRALARWSKCENIEILGNPQAPRLSITSLRIKWRGDDLHYGFVVALLNDLFGIQARGGCSCAGPYGHALLGMDMDYSKALEAQLLEGFMVLRPGWVRLNFNYFIDEETFEYLVRAVELVAEHGWRLLPYYRFDGSHGVWRFQDIKTRPAASLAELDFHQLTLPVEPTETDPADISLRVQLAVAERELCRDRRDAVRYSLELPAEAEQLRWFVAPQEVTRAQAR